MNRPIVLALAILSWGNAGSAQTFPRDVTNTGEALAFCNGLNWYGVIQISGLAEYQSRPNDVRALMPMSIDSDFETLLSLIPPEHHSELVAMRELGKDFAEEHFDLKGTVPSFSEAFEKQSEDCNLLLDQSGEAQF